MTWGLPEPPDTQPQQAACEQLVRAVDDHWRLGLACADLGLWDAWASHCAALDVVTRALRAEARESVHWSVAT